MKALDEIIEMILKALTIFVGSVVICWPAIVFL